MYRVLIIEDSADLALELSAALRTEGYHPSVAHDGETGVHKALTERPHLVILDLMLPGVPGHEVLRRFRQSDPDTPVIVLSTQSEEADKVIGFRLGADDYVTKPFSRPELVARVQAMLRRRKPESADVHQDSVITFGDVAVNTATRRVTRNGEPIELAPREYDLLLALLRRRGMVVSRLQLLHEVWGDKGAVMSRTVDMHVAELRRKLEERPAKPRHILTVRQAGYRIES
jgi:two-component system, OmpR family, alkaline phosphatase synthesis response regulator PhoP